MILSAEETATSLIKRQGEIVTEMMRIYENEIRELKIKVTLLEDKNRQLKERLGDEYETRCRYKRT